VKAILENNWRQKSIENLEKQNFGNPSEAPREKSKTTFFMIKSLIV
jgi:hypothetical protein